MFPWNIFVRHFPEYVPKLDSEIEILVSLKGMCHGQNDSFLVRAVFLADSEYLLLTFQGDMVMEIQAFKNRITLASVDILTGVYLEVEGRRP